MATLPGCYLTVNLGKSIVVPPGPDIDVSDLNFTVVMHEDDPPIPNRFTTWGIAAEAAVLYQANNQKNKLLIGDSGNIYHMSDDVGTDDGTQITVVYQTGPLPEPEKDIPVIADKRIHEIWWQIGGAVPATGFAVTITVFDADDSNNYVTLPLVQTTRKMRVRVGLRCRQCRVKWQVTSNRDYAITSHGIAGQILGRPYTKKASFSNVVSG